MDTMDKYIGCMLDGRYEILEVIGSGGMAVVYKALCHRLNRYVAVKILRDDLAVDPDFRRRFQTESQAVGMLSDPNIVAVYDVSRTGDPEYIVMELIEGITLKQYMEKKGTLNWKEAVHFTTQIAKALAHAHGKGIVHRDIKPHNIMITQEGAIKVADFGIARLQNTQNTLTDEALGSVHYISPEQARGEKADTRSDIYSLGVVMYEMLTGKLPFDGASPVAVALQHVGGVATKPRNINKNIPYELECITMKAMNQDINKRYQTVDELMADLELFRKNKTALASKFELEKDETADDTAVLPEIDTINKNVRPIGRSGELSKAAYARRRHRANKVSTLLGFLIVIIFVIAIFVFLWNYWLKDIFSTPERVNIPNFVGDHYEDVYDDFDGLFNFEIVYVIDPNTPEGVIVSQYPEDGKSMMVVSEGIDIQLYVSTGVKMEQIPNVINMEYRKVIEELEAKGFVVSLETAASSDITKDYVISTNPAADEELPSGSTIYVTVSGGPEVIMVKMPNLYGYTKETAEYKLLSLNLTVGTITPVQDDLPEGTVIWQSEPAGTEVAEHTKIFLQVSTGPKEEPEDENEETPPDVNETPGDTGDEG